VVELLNVCFDAGSLSLVLSYIEHSNFREIYTLLSPREVGCYMGSLLRALEHVHSRHIIHRDIKPANFLYSRENRTGFLIDFGLAQRENELPREAPQPTVSGSNPQPKSTKTRAAERAGTRGFRAPEVLLSLPQQTCAIDIWSAGVILLTLLTHRYPFFSAPDDLTALAEINLVLGKGHRMQPVLDYCGRSVTWPDLVDVPDLAETVRKLGQSSAPRYPPGVYSLLESLLEPHPVKRATAHDASLVIKGLIAEFTA